MLNGVIFAMLGVLIYMVAFHLVGMKLESKYKYLAIKSIDWLTVNSVREDHPNSDFYEKMRKDWEEKFNDNYDRYGAEFAVDDLDYKELLFKHRVLAVVLWVGIMATYFCIWHLSQMVFLEF